MEMMLTFNENNYSNFCVVKNFFLIILFDSYLKYKNNLMKYSIVYFKK